MAVARSTGVNSTAAARAAANSARTAATANASAAQRTAAPSTSPVVDSVPMDVPSAASSMQPPKAKINGMADLDKSLDTSMLSRGDYSGSFDKTLNAGAGFYKRGFIKTTAEPIVGGARITVDTFHTQKNDRLTLLLQGEVFDKKTNQLRTVNLSILADKLEINGDNPTGQATFDINYDDINKFLQEKNPGLTLHPGTTKLAVAALWMGSWGVAHRAGGPNRDGDFRLPQPLGGNNAGATNALNARIGAMTTTSVSGSQSAEQLPVDLTVKYSSGMKTRFSGIIKEDGKVGTRAEKEFKGTIGNKKEWQQAVGRGYALATGSADKTIEQVLGKGWEISTVDRYFLNTEGELLNQTDDKGNDVKVGTAAVDDAGNPVPEPMVDTYMADKAMKALANQVVVRLRANKQGVQLNVKPGGGLSDADLPQLKSRVEFFMDLKPDATAADAKKLLAGLNDDFSKFKSGPFNHGQALIEQLGIDGLQIKDTLNEVLELTQTRHKFTVKNDKGLEVELSIDEVTARTKLPEHNGPDGKPQSVTFYQVEGEMDHVQLKTSSNAADFDLPSDISSFNTDAAQTRWLENTSKDAGEVTMDVEPRLHDLKDLENPAERNNASYNEFKSMLTPLMDYLFPNGTTDAIQKGAEAAAQMDLLPKD